MPRQGWTREECRECNRVLGTLKEMVTIVWVVQAPWAFAGDTWIVSVDLAVK